MDKASADLANVATGSRLKYRAKGGKVNMCKAIDDLRNRSLEEGREKGIEEGIKEGRKEGIKEGREEAQLTAIKNIMQSLKMTAKQAMEVLKVPGSEQEKYLAKL